ncbi:MULTISPECIES: TetR/AcrR family transcriptional regulator [unclassified Leucobacter]|uniref:TetR/AcrR family transcriptional regulator n=1 Tax=unclassified Leucobacter TaxID=2621730 RepID=UPI003019E126
MSDSQRRARRRPGENRERLIEAGLTEFGLFGYHGASTSSIAARAQVPQPHVYANFETKQQLFLACFDRVCDALLAEHREPDSEGIQRFLFQAVSAAADPVLRFALLGSLLELRDALGDSEFDALLAAGAHSMLRTDADAGADAKVGADPRS